MYCIGRFDASKVVLVRCKDGGMSVEEKKVIRNLKTRRTSMYIWTGGGDDGVL